MLPLFRGIVSGRLRRSLSTAASRPPWAMIYRVSQPPNTTESVPFSFAPPPSVSFMSMPTQAFDVLDPHPPSTESRCIGIRRGIVVAASGEGLLLLDTHMTQFKAHPLMDLDLPVEQLMKIAPFEALYRRFARFVCNPVTGQLLRLPDFDGAEETLTDGMGLLTQADRADGPPRRYAAAQLSEADGWGGRRLLLRRFSSETGDWDDLVLPSPLPPGRRMHMIHEVLDFGGRLWWVDVSWGAVSLDPFSDRPELRPVELPADSLLHAQLGEKEMQQLVKHRHMGVSAGRLCYAEVGPFNIRSFTLDDESGRWTLEHRVPVGDLWPSAKGVVPLIATIDPLNADVLHLNMDECNVSVDMRQKRVIQSRGLPSGISPPSRSGTFSYLPCVLPSFLGSTPIPGKKDVAKNKTLADVLVRSDRTIYL